MEYFWSDLFFFLLSCFFTPATWSSFAFLNNKFHNDYSYQHSEEEQENRRMARNGKGLRKCYYETLGLERDCTDDDIKKAYRKLALQWHPDKHSHLEESDPEEKREIERRFVAIQQAYEVLIDPQERAWYDRHRDEILLGTDRDEIRDDGVDLMPYFSTFCYSGYGTDEKGFYAIYGSIFKKIAEEDVPYKDEDKLKEQVPEFFGPDATLDQVRSFYSYWTSYCTSKTFMWLGEWDIREAINRREVRAMEKENKKVREEAKRKRNQEVRQLAEFVRKRDKRVAAFKRAQEEKVKANRAKTEEMRREHLAKQAQQAETYKEPEWMSIEELEKKLKKLESHYSDDEEQDSLSDEEQVLNTDEQAESESQGKGDPEDDDQEENFAKANSFLCVACDKSFKSMKAFENHEKSNKHKQMVAALKKVLERDEAILNGNAT